VFVVMVIAASRPVLASLRALLGLLSRLAPVRTELALVWLGLALVPLAGSLVTEPAAMTLAALTLAPHIFRQGIPEWISSTARSACCSSTSRSAAPSPHTRRRRC
jgi:hypothetical protein